jgi:hypothetical protein
MRGWAIVAVVAAQAGCSSGERRDHDSAAVSAAASSSDTTGTGQGLYDLPEMRNARFHRERGARAMEEAYASRKVLERDNAFEKAWGEFKTAEDHYHAALTAAATRFRPVIESEIASVAEYMRQIQRDRNTLRESRE